MKAKAPMQTLAEYDEALVKDMKVPVASTRALGSVVQDGFAVAAVIFRKRRAVDCSSWQVSPGKGGLGLLPGRQHVDARHSGQSSSSLRKADCFGRERRTRYKAPPHQ